MRNGFSGRFDLDLIRPRPGGISMTFLRSLLSLPREGLVITAIIVAALLATCLFALFSQRRFVTIKKSEETELMAFHLRRIADALEQLANTNETRPPVDADTSSQAGMSIFGR